MKIISGLALLLFVSVVKINAGTVCSSVQEKLDEAVEKNKEQEKALCEMNKILTELKEKMDKLETSRCAFSATGTTISATGTTNHTVKTDSSPIVFPAVKLNTCGGYDEKTGIFTATIAGTYEFNMHVRSQGTDNGSIYVRKNNKVICSAWVDSDKKSKTKRRDMAACSVVTELVPGDKVKVTGENSNPAKITGNKMGFSGILIYPA